ncbi:Hsp70 family protein [Ideonella sp. TBM-1]|uniref:Hsp70 family protein n=2 Tax=Ideonella livida TaxID=2707176 RepID=A0A7C9PJP1_9BURK|nr:Hsp70 family protein [Ideonella livida]
MALVPLEDGQPTMPTAVFYLAEGPDLGSLPRLFGRAAMAAYLEGSEGRLMRSMKSVLGSSLMDQHTDIGAGRSVSFADVIGGYLRHLKASAETHAGRPLDRVVMGRPVYFVDEDPARDAQAQDALEAAARAVGFTDVAFQFEPMAAALHHEATVATEQRVLVCDIGGGTSDFSLVRIGPDRHARLDRREDVLAHHGVHIAGTDFDRRVELAAILPALGYRTLGPAVAGQPPREVPSGIYFDLATWHLINGLYRPQRLAEARNLKVNFADPSLHARLIKVLTDQLGHELLTRAERAKIAVAEGGDCDIDLRLVERGLQASLTSGQAEQALQDDLGRITTAALETARRAGLAPQQIDVLYFTGGSTGLRLLTDALAAAFPAAQAVHGERLASVATGLGLYARRLFG